MKRSLLFLCLAVVSAVAAEETSLSVRHPLSVLTGEAVEVRLSAYNRKDELQLFPSVERRLLLQRVERGAVLSTDDLTSLWACDSERIEVKPRKNADWKIHTAVNRPGIFRFILGLGGLTATGRLFRAEETARLHEGVSITYTPDRKSYFLGEPISVRMVLKNEGEDALPFEEGGDYRGANRHLRYVFTATAGDGTEAVDPKPGQPCFGGIGRADPRLAKGETYEMDLPLLAYLRFPKPGLYQVECFQDLGVGYPDERMQKNTPPWGWSYTHGGTFGIELKAPTGERMTETLKQFLGKSDKNERRRAFSTLHHSCYAEPILQMIKSCDGEEEIAALFCGLGSIMTRDVTGALIDLCDDSRDTVRIEALRHLSWRLPDPRDIGDVPADCPFRFHSSEARRRDSLESWREGFRPKVARMLRRRLSSEMPREAAVAAYCLGALAETNAVRELAQAADRFAPRTQIPEEHAKAVNQIADSAALIARVGAAPCDADRGSSPGRLAMWANMMRTKKEYRTGDWEGLLLHMLRFDCDVTRMAAIRWLPEDFDRREEIPWKALFLEKNRQTWWHAIQIARQRATPGLKEAVLKSIDAVEDKSKSDDLNELLKEIEAREAKESGADLPVPST